MANGITPSRPNTVRDNFSGYSFATPKPPTVSVNLAPDGPVQISEMEVLSKRVPSLAYGLVGLEIHLLAFDRAPQPFDEDGVPPATFITYADIDRGALINFNKASRQRAIMHRLLQPPAQAQIDPYPTL